jgi:hypothetical protein
MKRLLRYVNGMYIELHVLGIILYTSSAESIAYDPVTAYRVQRVLRAQAA